MDLTTIIFFAIVAAIIKFLLTSNPGKINGVYSQPGKWYRLKYVLFSLLLKLRKRQLEKQAPVTGETAGYGRKSRNTPEEMDRVQQLPNEHPKAVDAVYFTGSNEAGQFLVTATARRHNNVVQTILFLRLPGVGLLELPSLPDTTLEGSIKGQYAAGGLLIKVVEPMKKWTIKYDGKLRLKETQEMLDVNFEFEWTACSKYFDFDTDLHHDVLCDGISREPWSRNFFDTLKIIHQTHYEQFGDTTGTVHIKGRDDITVNVRGVRDHSYGNIRNWRQLHRYCLQYVSISDGKKLCVGTISMPVTTSRLNVGYLFHPDGRMDSVSSTDFEFYNWGDDKNACQTFTINLVAGGQKYCLEGKVIQGSVFYIGEDRDAKIFERFCNYTLNGVKGWGLSEWEYVNTDGTHEEKKLK